MFMRAKYKGLLFRVGDDVDGTRFASSCSCSHVAAIHLILCYLDLHDQHSKTNMLAFISSFLASLAMMIMMPVVDASGGGAFAVKPHFAKDDIIVNQRKSFVECGEKDNDGRKTGEAFLSRQAMDKIREAVGLPPLGSGAAHTGGATVQATLISKTTRMHSDSHGTGCAHP